MQWNIENSRLKQENMLFSITVLFLTIRHFFRKAYQHLMGPTTKRRLENDDLNCGDSWRCHVIVGSAKKPAGNSVQRILLNMRLW